MLRPGIVAAQQRLTGELRRGHRPNAASSFRRLPHARDRAEPAARLPSIGRCASRSPAPSRTARSAARTPFASPTARGFALGVVAQVADELRPTAGRRRRHLRRQPQHQLHQRLLQALHGSAPSARPPRRARLLAADPRAGAARARGMGLRRDRGLHPGAACRRRWTVALRRALQGHQDASCPDIHIHAFSPEEIMYGAVRAGISIPAYLKALREAGLGTLPGTSAEILDDEVRDRIAPGRITPRPWIEIITPRTRSASAPRRRSCTATSRRPDHVAASTSTLLRDIQQETRRLHRVRAAVVHPPGSADDVPAPRGRRRAAAPSCGQSWRCTRSRASCSARASATSRRRG